MDRLSWWAIGQLCEVYGQQELTSKQILDFLHVDFHIADFDCIFDITIRLDYRSEDLLDDTRDQTFEWLICDIRSLLISYHSHHWRIELTIIAIQSAWHHYVGIWAYYTSFQIRFDHNRTEYHWIQSLHLNISSCPSPRQRAHLQQSLSLPNRKYPSADSPYQTLYQMRSLLSVLSNSTRHMNWPSFSGPAILSAHSLGEEERAHQATPQTSYKQ